MVVYERLKYVILFGLLYLRKLSLIMRKKRMTKRQKQIIVNYLDENKEIASIAKGNYEVINNEWKDLANMLNKDDLGSTKTVQQ